ncbi:hypothetical protein EDB81DRAFT_250235 [Dactylonectria macrodidyma]|uniref:Uncharacterized protein n=1 Tax=Dactylonectria macrodidyma TaxID=307937 RepID=A0A9P9FLV1_9HYPO|nr:hypothetical protein EDB81DRAFT_250235 [Dactylonectria macrodidyma]
MAVTPTFRHHSRFRPPDAVCLFFWLPVSCQPRFVARPVDIKRWAASDTAVLSISVISVGQSFMHEASFPDPPPFSNSSQLSVVSKQPTRAFRCDTNHGNMNSGGHIYTRRLSVM